MNVRTLAVTAVTSLIVACGGESDPELQGYNPVVPGLHHEYQVTTVGGSPATSHMQIVAASATGYTRRTMTSGQTGSTDAAYLLVGGSEYGESRTIYSDAGAVLSTTTYAPPFLLLSADDTAASTETTVSTVTTGGSSYQSTRVVTVNGLETVTVPAGTFTALKTTAHITDSLGFDGYNVNWWAWGVGRVKIMNYPASNPSSGTTWVLTGYGT